MTNTLTAEQIAQGWIAYTGNGEPPFKKEVNGPPFQLGRMHEGELCTTAVITESLPEEIDWSDVAAYRVWAPSLPSLPVSGGAAWARTDLPFRTHDTLNGGYKYGSLNVAAIWERQGCAVQHRSEASPLTNEPVGVTPPRQAHSRHQWAQPGDEEHRTFILRFSDPDCGDQVFTGRGAEQRAYDAWNLYSPSWNVYLFGTVPLSAAIGERG